MKLGPVFYAFQFAVCGEKSSPPRFVGHLALLLLAELTFTVSTHIPLRSQREPVASVTCKRESVLFLDGKFVHIHFVGMVMSSTIEL